MNITIIVLAAGASSRLGQPKQLLLFRGHSLLRHVAEVACASRAKDVAVVLGHASALMQEELRGLRARIVDNGSWRSGLSSSIRAGILTAPPSVDGSLLMLCDQPLVTTDHLHALMDAFSKDRNRAAASFYAGSLGVPALFPRAMFGELLQLTGDAGAKAVLRTHADDIIAVPWPDGEVDIDSQADAPFIL